MRTRMKFNEYDAVPEWARFLTLDEFRAFLAAIERDLLGRALDFEDRDGLLYVEMPDGRTARCGLANVAVKCGAAGRDGYAREVAAHFDRIIVEPDPEDFPATFDEVSSEVRLRVYTDEFVAQAKGEVVCRRLAAGLQAVAVYHLPHGALSMPMEHLRRWKTSPDEALRVAIANTAEEKMMRETFELDAGDAFALLDMAGYAASHALLLEKHLPPSPHGAIVALPSRHVLICYPIVLSTVMEVLRELVPRVEDIYEEPPGDVQNRLSTDLFWWRDGEMTSMGAGMNLAGLKGSVLVPPQAFIDTVMVQAMMQAKKAMMQARNKKKQKKGR